MGNHRISQKAFILTGLLVLGSSACGVSKNAIPEKLNITETPSDQVTPAETIYPTTTPLEDYYPVSSGTKPEAKIYSQDAWWFAEVKVLDGNQPVSLLFSGHNSFGINAELLSPTLATFKSDLIGGATTELYRWYKADAKAKLLLAKDKAEVEQISPSYEISIQDVAKFQLTTDVRIHVALQGLHVEAFDKDLAFDETLGSASDDLGGQFTMLSNFKIYSELGKYAAPRPKDLSPIFSLGAKESFPPKFAKGFVSSVSEKLGCNSRQSECIWEPKVFSADFDVAQTSILDVTQAALREVSDLETSANLTHPTGSRTDFQIALQRKNQAPFAPDAWGWHPRAVVSHADRDTYEAAQAALAGAATSAKVAGAFTKATTEVLGVVIRAEFQELTARLAKLDSAGEARILDLFSSLLGSLDHTTSWTKAQLPSASQLGTLAKVITANAKTADEVQDLANFTLLTDEIKTLQTIWLANCEAFHACYKTKTAFSPSKLALLNQNLILLEGVTYSSETTGNPKIIADLYAFASQKGPALLASNTVTAAESFRTQIAALQKRILSGESVRDVTSNMKNELDAMAAIGLSLSAAK
ncbi:hypothetical protein WDW86_05865 [Bdellovibrionota bacterium FG-2]